MYAFYLIMMFYQKRVFVQDKSSCISQFINGKSRNLQKLLRYLSGIVASTFIVGTAGCGGWFAFYGFSGCGLSGVFHTIFVLYLIDLPSEALSSTPILSLVSIIVP